MGANWAPETTRRRWFRFSLRTMLVLVTLVCVYLGWAMHWKHQRQEFLKASTAEAWPIRFGQMGPPSRKWAWLLGEMGYSMIILEGRAEDWEIEEGERLFPEATVTDQVRPRPRVTW